MQLHLPVRANLVFGTARCIAPNTALWDCAGSSLLDSIFGSIVRCILPDIIAYYETEEGQRQFQEWKAMQEAEKTEGKNGEKITR